MGKKVTGFSAEAQALLERYSWPGNVRELENAVERAVALESTEVILPERLPPALLSGPASRPNQDLGPGFSLATHLNRIERELLHEGLRLCNGDRARACQMLGVTPRALRYLISKHGAGGGEPHGT
jgi:DNA-binding NtrC family response regulator